MHRLCPGGPVARRPLGVSPAGASCRRQAMRGPAGALRLAADEPLQVNDLPRVMGRLQRLCRAARRDLSCCGVGIGVVSETGELVNVVGSSRTCFWVEELQFGLGEGPSLAAFASRRPVFVPNLMEAATTMWPEYAPAAHGEGLRAVFAFPLRSDRYGSAPWTCIRPCLVRCRRGHRTGRSRTPTWLRRCCWTRTRTPVRWPHLIIARISPFYTALPHIFPWPSASVTLKDGFLDVG